MRVDERSQEGQPIQPKGTPGKTVDVVVTAKELTEHDVSW